MSGASCVLVHSPLHLPSEEFVHRLSAFSPALNLGLLYVLLLYTQATLSFFFCEPQLPFMI
ncbi:hypothetical protein BRADI_4g19943v3 [Brachypodium distachyon]|uniref:Uncharacterized protein n=1 Tax=Brachypodium distachyon TaxID=15368 RepID=A0A2K2CNS3_BRADI|nr:hypothetical protein BRADI_4g19943v3 [Brachypodium distachyon]